MHITHGIGTVVPNWRGCGQYKYDTTPQTDPKSNRTKPGIPTPTNPKAFTPNRPPQVMIQRHLLRDPKHYGHPAVFYALFSVSC